MSGPESNLPFSRGRLAAVLRTTKEVVSVDLVVKTIGVDRRRAAQLLSRWRAQGWLRRVGHGLYVAVPLELSGSEQVVADPWVLVPSLFGHSYIGGWTAAQHWELTEQLFNKTLVFTTRRIRAQQVTAQGVQFALRRASSANFFGLTTLWRGTTKVAISDAPRTIVDMLAKPAAGGGIDHVEDCLAAYVRSKAVDRDLLLRYAEQFDNGAVFKRLGFLAETRLHDRRIAEACRDRLTHGYAKLDPALPPQKLVTAWRLWVPSHWKRT